jgi:Cof subfamily protein (haloacid dehalogenase superfamily)
MKIEMLAFDLDGTTLNSKKEISKGNRDALEKAHKAGIKLVPCTGRSISYLSDPLARLIDDLGTAAFPYIITDNGAQAFSLPNQELLVTNNISEETALLLLKTGRECQAIINASFGAESATDNMGAAWDSGLAQDMLESSKEKWYVPVADIAPLIRWNCGAVKIAILFDDAAERRKEYARFEKFQDITIVSGGPASIECIKKGVCKGKTLRFVSEHAGIPMERIMAIGDHYNDLEMIADAGFGVAMGNAVEELKEKAAWITATNDEDGLALAIEKALAG